MTRLSVCSLRLLVCPQGLPGGLLYVLFHHGERFLDLLDVVRSTRATLALHADAEATRMRRQGTARRRADVAIHARNREAGARKTQTESRPCDVHTPLAKCSS